MKKLCILFLMLCLLPTALLAQKKYTAKGMTITSCYVKDGYWAREYPSLQYIMNNPTTGRIKECAWARGIAINTCTKQWEAKPDLATEYDCNQRLQNTKSPEDAVTLKAYIFYYDKQGTSACQLINNVETTLVAIETLSYSTLQTSQMQEMIKTLKYIGYDVQGAFSRLKLSLDKCPNRTYKKKFNWARGKGVVTGDLKQVMPGFRKKIDSTTIGEKTAVTQSNDVQQGKKKVHKSVTIKGNGCSMTQTNYSDGVSEFTGTEIVVNCEKVYKGKVTVDNNINVGGSGTKLTPYQKEECEGNRKFPTSTEKAGESVSAGENNLVGDVYIDVNGILVSDFPVAYNCSRMIEPELANSYFGVRIEKKTGKILQGKPRFMKEKEKEACKSGKMFEENKKGQEWTDTKKGKVGENFKKNKKQNPSSCKKNDAESDANKTSYHCTKTQIINNEKKVVPVGNLSDSTPKVVIWRYKNGTYDIKQGQVYELGDKDEEKPKDPQMIIPPPPPFDPELDELVPKMKCNLVNYTGLCADGDTQEKELTGDRPGWEITSRCPVEIIGKNIRIVPDDIDKAFVVKMYSDGQTPAYEIVENGKELLLEPKEEEKNDEKEDDDKKLVNPDDNGLAPDAKKESTPGEGHGDEKDVDGSPFGEGEDPEGVIGGVPKGINTSWWYKIGFRAGAVPKIDKFTRNLEQVEASQQGGGN